MKRSDERRRWARWLARAPGRAAIRAEERVLSRNDGAMDAGLARTDLRTP